MANANGEHPINGLMNVTLEKIRQMVDSNTIIGEPISTGDGTTILPVSKVSFGFTSGGSDFVSSKAPKEMFGGGSGAGVTISPVAFLVISGENVRLMQLAEKSGTADRALNMVPDVVDKISNLISKNKKEPKIKEKAEQGANSEQEAKQCDNKKNEEAEDKQ